MFERTPQFEAYIAPAKSYPAVWRILVGVVTAVLVYAGFGAAVFGSLALFLPAERVTEIMLTIAEAEDPLSMFILLATFIGMALGAVVAAFWHWRGLASLIGPLGPAGRKFLDTLTIVVPLLVISGLLVSFVTDFELTGQMPVSTWAMYMLLGLPLLFIQTGAEELIFRGYLMQQLAARFRSFVIWGMIPTVLFGLAHYSGEFGSVTAGLVVFTTGFFGFVAMDLTRITGNLGAAAALHFANNFFALFIVGISGQLSGLALYLAPFTMADAHIVRPLFVVDIIVIAIIWQILRRRYA